MAMMAPAIAAGTAVPVVVTIMRGRLIPRLRLRIAGRLCVGLRCCRMLGWRCHGKYTRKEQKT